MHPNITRHGSIDPLPVATLLHAGKLSVIYESGFLRYIKAGDVEIIRVINHFIRDRNWANAPMTILSEQIENNGDGFSIDYTAECVIGDIQFDWSCGIIGKRDSSITFKISGISRHPFWRNRLGFTVLHPIETCVGRPCVITHADDSNETLTFPESISPHQPFVDIKAMRWSPSEGIDAILNFEGDLFETEDQRNWLDASYKTYCTPLTKPFPFLVEKDDRVDQVVFFKAEFVDEKVKFDSDDDAVSFAIDKSVSLPFPKIGIPLNNLDHDQFVIENLRTLNVDFVRIVVRKDETDLDDKFAKATALTLPVEVVLFIEKEGSTDWINQLIPFAHDIIHIIVLSAYGKSADGVLLGRVVPGLRRDFPNAKIGSGTDTYFTELNRERTPSDLLDFLSFSATPQAHASDLKTMTENVVTHVDIARTCRDFTNKDIHVGPVTLKARSNPAATVKAEAEGLMPPDVDPKILSLYAACWTVGGLKYLFESGMRAVTLYEACGWKGLMDHQDQAWPSEYRITSRIVYPVYLVLKEILKRKDQKVVKLLSNAPLKVDGLALIDKSGVLTVLLANYTDESVSCKIPRELQGYNSYILGEDSVGELIVSPGLEWRKVVAGDVIELPHYSVALISDRVLQP